MTRKREKIYWVWSAMVQRCTNPNNKSYHNYGGRGIFVCEEWLHTGEAFMEWAQKNGYREGFDLDRIDNNGPYCPENCRFVNRSLSMQNRRTQRTSTTGISGVWYHPKTGGYRVVISSGGVKRQVGMYKTIQEAKSARREAELKYWGWTKIPA